MLPWTERIGAGNRAEVEDRDRGDRLRQEATSAMRASCRRLLSERMAHTSA